MHLIFVTEMKNSYNILDVERELKNHLGGEKVKLEDNVIMHVQECMRYGFVVTCRKTGEINTSFIFNTRL